MDTMVIALDKPTDAEGIATWANSQIGRLLDDERQVNRHIQIRKILQLQIIPDTHGWASAVALVEVLIV